MTDELDIQYKGISGKAMVSKISYNLDKVSDEDSKNFYKSISYYATPSFGLKNGDEIKIVASYSEFKAKQLGITIKNKEKTIKVDGLAEPFKEKDDVKKEFLKKLDESVNEKLEKWKEKLAGSLGNKDNIKPELEGIYLIPYKDERSADIGYVYTVKGQFPGIFRAPKDEDMTRVCTIIFRDVNDSVDVEKLIINTDEKELKEDIDKTVREMLLTRDLQKDLIKLN